MRGWRAWVLHSSAARWMRFVFLVSQFVSLSDCQRAFGENEGQGARGKAAKLEAAKKLGAVDWGESARLLRQLVKSVWVWGKASRHRGNEASREQGIEASRDWGKAR